MIAIRFSLLLFTAWALVSAATAQKDGQQQADIAQLETLSRLFRAAHAKVAPGVVMVTTTSHRSAGGDRLPPTHPPIGGAGSGTVVSRDGYILSNYHVISGADSIEVILPDRRSFSAQVVGFDSLIDIALLKVDATDLQAVELGDSDQLQIGDWVLAIGHPLRMRSTLTHGIVSALNREARILRDPGGRDRNYSIESFIQTNAVINPGNSGGPLLDLRGRVIGINTAISTDTGYFIGYGLAVPINLAREAMNDLLAYGRVVRGYLGIEMVEVDQQLMARHRLGMDRPRGVFIMGVKPDGPAARAGLKAGDVLLQVEAVEVHRPNQVQTLIYARDPGDTVALQVLRDQALWRLDVKLGELEDDRMLARGRQRLEALGLVVEQLDDERAQQLGFTAEVAAQLGFGQGERAVIVVGVDPEGAAAQKGIAVHDVIAEIDQMRVTSLTDFFRSLSHLQENRAALFWLWRRDRGINMRALKIPSQVAEPGNQRIPTDQLPR